MSYDSDALMGDDSRDYDNEDNESIHDPAEYNGPIIELYISMSYDARTHRRYFRVPEDWDTMDQKEKDEHIREATENFFYSTIDYGHVLYDSVEKAVTETRDRCSWGDVYSRGEEEEYLP